MFQGPIPLFHNTSHHRPFKYRDLYPTSKLVELEPIEIWNTEYGEVYWVNLFSYNM